MVDRKFSMFCYFVQEDCKKSCDRRVFLSASKTMEISKRSCHGLKHMPTKRNLSCCHGSNIHFELVEGMSQHA